MTKRTVDLWHVRTDSIAGSEVLAACARMMSAEERARHDRLVFERNRHEFLVTRALARSVLGRELGRAPVDVRFRITEHGQPLLVDGGDLRFNLTNTLVFVACAVARGHDVGVDAEPLVRAGRVLGLAEKVFTASERAALGRLSGEQQERRAVALWTSKEAYMKVRGLGMAIPPHTIDLDFDERGNALLADWAFTTLELERHLVSVCVAAGPFEVRPREVTGPGLVIKER